MAKSKRGQIDFSANNNLVVAAHEIKSPLSLIRQLALTLDDKCIDPKQKKIINRIILSAEKSIRFTSNITKCANLTEEMFPLETVNAYQICDEVANELYPLYVNSGKKIEVIKKKKTELIVANRDLLRRILLGFGDNSLYYANNDTVEFSIRNRSSKNTIINLKDTGPSVSYDKNLLKHKSIRPESSGIGLVLAENFANFMNGKTGYIKHRNGMSYYVDLIKSEQLGLFV